MVTRLVQTAGSGKLWTRRIKRRDRRYRSWRRRQGRRCGASRVAWLGVDEEDDDAEPLDMAEG